MKTDNHLGWISNLSSKYEKYRYLLLEALDPSPPKKKMERIISSGIKESLPNTP